jgi:hypothetical protein
MMGSPTVLINNMMACRMGDIVVEKPGLAMGPANPIIMGEPTVMIGDVGMGSPVVVTPESPMAALSGGMAAGGSAGAQSAVSAAKPAQSGTASMLRGLGSGSLQNAAGLRPENAPVVVSPGKTSWVEIALVDEQGNPVAGEQYQIVVPDGSAVEGPLDAKGLARVEGIDPGNCKITFPNLDKSTWRRK